MGWLADTMPLALATFFHKLPTDLGFPHKRTSLQTTFFNRPLKSILRCNHAQSGCEQKRERERDESLGQK